MRFEHATRDDPRQGRAGRAGSRCVETIWGPVVDTDHEGRRRALALGGATRRRPERWRSLAMEQARDVDEALQLAPRVGHPAPEPRGRRRRAAGSAGRSSGRIPQPRRLRRPAARRRGPTARGAGTAGSRPRSSRASSTRRAAGSGPRTRASSTGDELDARRRSAATTSARGQRQIRDDLLALDKASETRHAARPARRPRALPGALAEAAARAADARGRRQGPAARRGAPLRRGSGADARRDLVGRLPDRAAVPRPGLARRAAAARRGLPAADPRFDYLGRRPNQGGRQWEGPLWALVTERPLHLLDPRFTTLGRAAAGARSTTALDELTQDGAPLSRRTWGERNTALHPAPALARGAASSRAGSTCQHEPLPGDGNMPRVQAPSNGASERLAVSPGREDAGLLPHAGGQSGHPLSATTRTGTPPGRRASRRRSCRARPRTCSRSSRAR